MAKDQMVSSVTLNGETFDLGETMSMDDAQSRLQAMGFSDQMNGSTPHVNEGTLSFHQENGEKG